MKKKNAASKRPNVDGGMRNQFTFSLFEAADRMDDTPPQASPGVSHIKPLRGRSAQSLNGQSFPHQVNLVNIASYLYTVYYDYPYVLTALFRFKLFSFKLLAYLSLIFSLNSSELPRSSGAYMPLICVGKALNLPGISARRR